MSQKVTANTALSDLINFVHALTLSETDAQQLSHKIQLLQKEIWGKNQNLREFVTSNAELKNTIEAMRTIHNNQQTATLLKTDQLQKALQNQDSTLQELTEKNWCLNTAAQLNEAIIKDHEDHQDADQRRIYQLTSAHIDHQEKIKALREEAEQLRNSFRTSIAQNQQLTQNNDALHKKVHVLEETQATVQHQLDIVKQAYTLSAQHNAILMNEHGGVIQWVAQQQTASQEPNTSSTLPSKK